MSDERVAGDSPSTSREENPEERVIQNMDHPAPEDAHEASSQGSRTQDHVNPDDHDHVIPDDPDDKLKTPESEKTEEKISGGEGSGRKKKKRAKSKGDDDKVGSSSGSGGERKQKRAHVLDAPNTDPSCPECCKKFSSWKAMFGHMKKHPGKGYGGAFPPPKFTPPTSPKIASMSADEQQEIEEAVPALLDLARRITALENQKTTDDGGGTQEELPINLNDSQAHQEEAPPPPSEIGDVAGFDLNVTPPREDEDADE